MINRDEIDRIADQIALCAARIDSATHQLLTHIRHFDEKGGWYHQGAKTCAHWLSWRIGGGLVTAREKVRVARALGKLPLIDAALEAGEISYCKVRAMTRIATPSNEALLLQFARSSTGAQLERICRGVRRVDRKSEPPDRKVRKRQTDDGLVRIEMQLLPDEAAVVWQALQELKAELRDSAEASEAKPTLADAAVALAEHKLACGATRARPGADRRELLVHLREDRIEKGKLCAELTDGTQLSGETFLRIACDSGLVAAKIDAKGAVLDLGRRRRAPSAALMRALRIRDGSCAFPGCTCNAYLEAHHIEHWAQGGETTMANTTLLCWTHHTLIHEGGFRVERGSDGALRFFDPRGRVIERVPQAPELGGDSAEALAHDQASRGVSIDERTSLPNWFGDPLDLFSAVGALIRREDHGRPCGS